MDCKCLRLVRICCALLCLTRGLYHIVQARAVVLLLFDGVFQSLITNNRQQARVFLCPFINSPEFVPLRKTQLIPFIY